MMLINQNIGEVNGRCSTTQTNATMFTSIGENTEASKYEMGSGDKRSTIKRAKSEKDLGVFIDEKINFREHITKKVNIANRNLGIFRSFTYMDKEMFLNLYKSMVRPI